MHPHLKSLLVSAGCDPGASDDEAKKFYDGMSAEKKVEIDGKMARLMEGDDVESLRAAGTSATPNTHGEPPPPGNAIAPKDMPGIGTADPDPTGTSNYVQKQTAGTRAMPPLIDDGDRQIALEEKRVGQIKRLAALHAGLIPTELIQEQIGLNAKPEDARIAFLRHIHETAKPIKSIKVGDDAAITGLRAALPQAMMLRAGMEPAMFEKHGDKIHPQVAQLRGMRIRQMIGTYFAALGCPEVFAFPDARLCNILGPRGMRRELPKLAALGESVADFGNITLDAQNKTLRFYYLDAKRTWPIWAQKVFAPDFKNINRVVLSEAPSMKAVNLGGDIQYVTLADGKEVYSLVEYKEGIRIGRRAFINDDLDALSAIPRLHANAAARLEDDVAYNVITVNANMADGFALFSATAPTYDGKGGITGGHGNLTASGGAPSVSSLQIGATVIKKQKGIMGAARLELEPKFLLVPTSIEEQTKELIGSSTLIASQSSSGSAPSTVGDKNPFYNRYQVIGSTRLDDNSATKWYMSADYRDGQCNTTELCFLTDEPEPVIRQETDFDTEDVKYLCRHTVAGKAIDFRGLYANNGA